MLSEELESIHEALGKILGKMDPDAACKLRICRRNLDEAIEMANHMEKNFRPVDSFIDTVGIRTQVKPATATL